MSDLRALVVDYGGVLTGSLAEVMGAWLEKDRVDPAAFGHLMKTYLGAPTVAGSSQNPVHLLELGQLAIPDFEARLAADLAAAGSPVVPEGLVARMFAAFVPEPLMTQALRNARSAGLRTALLSNSWGMSYPRDTWAELFDVTVVSGEVGLRKPAPEIYLLTAQQLGLDPAQCVFVDDLAPNVRGASAVGMVGLHHTEPTKTLDELSALFGMRL